MPETKLELPRELGVRDLVLFNCAAVVSIRWLATAAHIGSGSLALWAGAAVFFFVPLALVVAGLNDRFPDEGGIYAWTGRGFGELHGFLCGWCYWLSNLFYFPNLLLVGIGIALYAAFPLRADLAASRPLMVALSLVALWVAVLTNLAGMRVGKWTQNFGASATLVAAGAIIVAGLAALARTGGATPLHVLPEWSWDNLNFWSQIAFAFGGLELGAIMSGEIRDPRRTVRRAAWISAAVIACAYMLGTLAILALLPPERISVVTGLAQAGEAAAAQLGWSGLSVVLGALIACGIMGQSGAWIGGSARLAFVIGLDSYLPAAFGRLHPRWQTPYVALLGMGIASTVFLVLAQLGDTLRTAYQVLVDVTVITYFIPFLYLFATAWKYGQRWSALSGLIVTAAGIAFSFTPPEGVQSVWLFELKIVGSCALLIASGLYFYARGRRRRAAAMEG